MISWLESHEWPIFFDCEDDDRDSVVLGAFFLNNKFIGVVSVFQLRGFKILPPIVFLQLVLIPAHVVAHAEHIVPRQRIRH